MQSAYGNTFGQTESEAARPWLQRSRRPKKDTQHCRNLQISLQIRRLTASARAPAPPLPKGAERLFQAQAGALLDRERQRGKVLVAVAERLRGAHVVERSLRALE